MMNFVCVMFLHLKWVFSRWRLVLIHPHTVALYLFGDVLNSQRFWIYYIYSVEKSITGMEKKEMGIEVMAFGMIERHKHRFISRSKLLTIHLQKEKLSSKKQEQATLTKMQTNNFRCFDLWLANFFFFFCDSAGLNFWTRTEHFSVFWSFCFFSSFFLLHYLTLVLLQVFCENDILSSCDFCYYHRPQTLKKMGIEKIDEP